ncbi:hypothetical protein GWI33_007288 [Rhynchophorus ferrugineus]|uniref:Uncharacterized protein n=1 Tax=Rhynchophorus ferrugineus TaxID=354439 RepID=A0A834ITE8_RHYFE|nr:hypothetical protein GWI33_007288 [Rhynchophorus ferrugineus]
MGPRPLFLDREPSSRWNGGPNVRRRPQTESTPSAHAYPTPVPSLSPPITKLQDFRSRSITILSRGSAGALTLPPSGERGTAGIRAPPYRSSVPTTHRTRRKTGGVLRSRPSDIAEQFGPYSRPV